MSKYLYSGFRALLSPLALAIISTFFVGNVRAVDTVADTPAKQQNDEFFTDFLNMGGGSQGIDVSRFARGGSAMPGTYRTDIYINDVLAENRDVEFKARSDKSVYPCLTAELIKSIPFNYDKLPASFLAPSASGEICVDLQKKLPAAQVNYDSNALRLNIVIPQIYLLKTARGSVSPELWDSGVPALLLGYNVNGYSSKSQGTTFNSLYASTTAGANVGAWYLRHNGAYSRTSDGQSQYSNLNTYLQRDIPLLKGRALIGQSNTSGTMFDTLPFTGVQLASDERMLPESLRGYAPEIRGIARSNARVTVRQGGQVLYETTVPPGAFLINDLYPTGYGGDLEVTVRESDGTEQNFKVPYAAVTQLLRPGASRYAFTAGELRNSGLDEKPMLYQGTYQYGLTNSLTGYAGVQASQHYYALQLGSSIGTPIGAVAFDVTQTRADVGSSTDAEGYQTGKTFTGQSYQLSYSKNIIETNSNLSLAAYRFSTDGYMDFMTAMQTRDAVARGFSPESVLRAKNRLTVSAGQGLPANWGQLYISSSVQNYWNQTGSDIQYQAGYNNQYKSLSYGLSVGRTYSSTGATQTNYLLSFSLPLGPGEQKYTPQLRTDLAHDTSGRSSQQVSLSGTAGADSQFGYGVNASSANQGQGASGSFNGSYHGRATAVSGSYSTGKGYQSTSAGLTGTVVGHAGGITFTPYNSETLALVEAKGAEGATVSSYPGISVDSRGYALVPYLNPYQLNEISIDPKGTANDVEFDTTTQKVAPYAGALVKVKYTAKRGQPILIVATYRGEPLPFGADVLDSKGNSVGAVGQGGQIYARVQEEKGQLQVKWGDSSDMQCLLGYRLLPQGKESTASAMQHFTSLCLNKDSGPN